MKKKLSAVDTRFACWAHGFYFSPFFNVQTKWTKNKNYTKCYHKVFLYKCFNFFSCHREERKYLNK